MPYEPYDPDKNWVYQNWVGRETGMGRGLAGSIGNAEYQRKLWSTSSQSGSAISTGVPTAQGRRRIGKVSQPWFPAVDAWLDRIPKWVHLLIGSIGALLGYAYGISAGWEPWAGAVLGGIAGLAFLPLCALALKLLLTAVILAVVVGVGYVALKLIELI